MKGINSVKKMHINISGTQSLDTDCIVFLTKSPETKMYYFFNLKVWQII